MSALPAPPTRTRPVNPAGTRPAGQAGTRPKTRRDVPDPAGRLPRLAAGFVSLFLEVEAGRRPRKQLALLMTPLLYARLSEVWVRGGPPGRVLTVAVVGRGRAWADVVVVVRRGRRCGAVSLRLGTVAGRWVVDDIAMPELGPLPAPAYPTPPAEPDDDADPLMSVPGPAGGPPAQREPDWLDSSSGG